MLMVGAGLVLKGFSRLIRNDPGFDPAPILTLDVTVSPQAYPDTNGGVKRVTRFLEPALARRARDARRGERRLDPADAV